MGNNASLHIHFEGRDVVFMRFVPLTDKIHDILLMRPVEAHFAMESSGEGIRRLIS